MQFPTIITVTTCYWRHDLYRLLPDSWHRTNAGPILRNVNIQTDNKWFLLLTRLLPTTRTQKHQKCGVRICSQYHITLTKFPQNRYAMHAYCTYKQTEILRWATSNIHLKYDVQCSEIHFFQTNRHQSDEDSPPPDTARWLRLVWWWKCFKAPEVGWNWLNQKKLGVTKSVFIK